MIGKNKGAAEFILTIAVVIVVGVLVLLLLPAPVTFDSQQPCPEPYDRIFDVVIKEKYVVGDRHRMIYLVRFYNKMNKEYYLVDDYNAFVKFNLDEPLILRETCDGQKITRHFQRATAETSSE